MVLGWGCQGGGVMRFLGHTTPEVFDPESGRLDAGRFAGYLRISLVEMASIVGVNVLVLREVPDCEAVQVPLRKLLLVVDSYKRLVGRDERQLRLWLGSPHPDLGGVSLLDLMLAGKISLVVELVEDMFLGA